MFSVKLSISDDHAAAIRARIATMPTKTAADGSIVPYFASEGEYLAGVIANDLAQFAESLPTVQTLVVQRKKSFDDASKAIKVDKA